MKKSWETRIIPESIDLEPIVKESAAGNDGEGLSVEDIREVAARELVDSLQIEADHSRALREFAERTGREKREQRERAKEVIVGCVNDMPRVESSISEQ